MTDTTDFAKIFVTGRTTRGELSELVARALDGEVASPGSVAGPGWEADVLPNPDAGHGPEDDFLFWPLLIEYYPAEDATRQTTVGNVSRLLLALWNSGLRACAAADYEDELPHHGGWHAGRYTGPANQSADP
ncbi:hypothetical protein LI90_1713 [Carbonactinospora thermoautotrophica]|uniref:Uncharacterized protein n=1 Tax=Carbonactinospora thermoautotrophica TaxID=1469144 RepID=A0A132MSH9_9ACTN|nr:hypothetical protein [Carbonactinospora thermoautotrophica]KWX00690.1 hypothetical protein LI90_1713 [Carbonactinospora thermoautotrophica]